MSSKRKRFWGNNPRYKKQKSATTSSSNRFQCLSDLDDDTDNYSVDSDVVTLEKQRIPPITVDNCHNFTDIMKLLGVNCKYKRMSIGTKVLPSSILEYEEAIKKLKTNDHKFFTHPIKDTKKFKLVLFGLPKLDIKTIFEEFKTSFNMEPVNIKEISTVRSSMDDALYSVEFDRSQVAKSDVRRIKYFYNVVVHWRNPLRRSRGPTQCTKCSMYGHGSSNCHRSAVCLGCGGAHDYANCQLNKVSSSGPVVYKCYNCLTRKMKNVNHRADDPKCPSRKEYLDVRRKVTHKHSLTRNTKYHSNVFISSDDEGSLPATGESLKASFSLPCRKDRRVSYANVTKSAIQQNDNDDISNEKILEIYFEALDALQKCRNKYDKMRVLGMMLKHVI